ncbi:MAG: hypothetical protein KF819_33120 [Labilithrix sp.]|nr:hypothetical protein [Labilithrix sp.]
MQPPHAVTLHSQHEAEREIARITTENMFNGAALPPPAGAQRFPSPITLGPIDQAALASWRLRWENHPQRRVAWDWSALRRRFGHRPCRYELAIHIQGNAVGLAVGRISHGRSVVRIDMIEGFPGPHPLKRWIIPVAVEFGSVLGQAYLARHLRLIDPSPHVVRALHAMARPFTFVARVSPMRYNHCQRTPP